MPAYPALLDPTVDSYKVMRESVNSIITALGNTSVVAHNQSAATITSGVLDILRIPTGILSSEVAVGNHSHAIGAITGFTDNSLNWDAAFAWGDWAGHTHADALLDADFAASGIMATNGAGVYSILTDNTVDWNTAFTHASSTHAPIDANNYIHPSGDGNLHIPPAGAVANGWVLSASAGAPVWSAAGAGGDVNQSAFSNFAVSGFSTVSADTATDTVTFVAGSNITISTNAATDAITFSSTQRAITNSTATTSSTTAASATAVKSAYDIGNHSHPYAATSHTHTGSTISALDAGDTTTGTFNILRIPTGTLSSQVALGNHSHSIYALLTGATFTGAISATTITATSDKKLKNIVSDYITGTASKIQAVVYNWKDKKIKEKNQIGYIAQDVEKVLPDAVATDQQGIKSVNYSMVHTAKISELEDKIRLLELQTNIMALKLGL